MIGFHGVQLVSEGFYMAKATIDRSLVREMHDNGVQLVDIAKKLGASKGAISKILKQMGKEVTTAAVQAAPGYVEKQGTVADNLLSLINDWTEEHAWIKEKVPRKTDPGYREWMASKLAVSGEIRKLISALADIGYKLYMANEVAEIFAIVDEEIGHESSECQDRIRERIQRRRNLRFPGFGN